jgi:hypothetical protein
VNRGLAHELRRTHLEDEVGLFPDRRCVGRDRRADLDVRAVAVVRVLARARLHDHLEPELPHPNDGRGGSRDPPLAGVYLLRDPDPHGPAYRRRRRAANAVDSVDPRSTEVACVPAVVGSPVPQR